MPEERFVLVYDRGQCIAVLDRHEWSFELLHGQRPAAPDEYSLPHYYHTPTLRGARLTACWWLDRRFAPSSQQRHLTFDQHSGERWSFRLDEVYKGEDQGDAHHEYSLRLEKQGYVVQCSAHLRLKRPCGGEFANFLAYGVGEAWAHRKKFTHTLWSGRDGKVLSLPHNPLHPVLPGAGAESGQRDISQGGFLGFFNASTPAWIIEIEESSAAVHSSTCDNSYDEHLQCAAPEHPASDGFFHSFVRYRLRQLPAEEADRVFSRAAFIEPFPGGEARESECTALGFAPGAMGSQGSQVKVGETFPGLCWPAKNTVCGQHGTALAAANGCGTASLQLRNEHDEETLELLPCGPSIALDSTKHYRLQARVKTNAVSQARLYLRARQIVYNLSKVEHCDESPHLSDVQDWTVLAVEIMPVAHDPYVVISLHLDGKGTAWFDDISLTEI